MKVFLLGLDGLDYYLVKEWKLRNLMLKHNGFFKIPPEYYHPREKVPFSPVIWTTIITGKKPSEHGVKDWYTWGRILDKIRTLPIIRRIKHKRKYLKIFGLRPKIVDKNYHRLNTLFDIVKPSLAIYFPGYNESPEFHYRLNDAFYRGNLNNYIKTVWQVHRERVKKLNEELSKNADYKLVAVYFDIADLLGHACFTRCRGDLKRAYRVLDLLVGRLYKLYGEDFAFIVVSDHGMTLSKDGVSGNHTDYAYYAISIDEEWSPKDFVDIYKKVLELIR